jgi:hypothetical protein
MPHDVRMINTMVLGLDLEGFCYVDLASPEYTETENMRRVLLGLLESPLGLKTARAEEVASHGFNVRFYDGVMGDQRLSVISGQDVIMQFIREGFSEEQSDQAINVLGQAREQEVPPILLTYLEGDFTLRGTPPVRRYMAAVQASTPVPEKIPYDSLGPGNRIPFSKLEIYQAALQRYSAEREPALNADFGTLRGKHPSWTE